MRIIITGSTGFIGKNLYTALKKSGHQVICISNSLHKKNDFKDNDDFRFGHFSDEVFVKSIIRKGDHVVHLAYSTVPENSVLDPVYDVESNVNSTITFLKICQEVQISKFIFISTGGVIYGNQSILPIPETAKVNPFSSYGITKLTIEKLIPLFMNNYCILRTSNVYGTGFDDKQNQGVINIWVKNIFEGKSITIFGTGTVIRDYIYITDFTEAIEKVIELDIQGLYNLGSQVGYSLLEILNELKKVIDKDFQINQIANRNFDVEANVLSIEKFKSVSKWEPRVTVVEGIWKIWLSIQPS